MELFLSPALSSEPAEMLGNAVQLGRELQSAAAGHQIIMLRLNALDVLFIGCSARG